MRQVSSGCDVRHLRLVRTELAAGAGIGGRWPAAASFLLVLGAGLASWSAILLTAWWLTG
jgi:hypothetical protein